jgi:hypothetical protein
MLKSKNKAMVPMKSQGSTSDKSRNAFAIHAKKRKSGEIRLRKDKRKNGKNKQLELLKEND